MGLIRRSPTTAFFVLAYVLGWIFSLPNLLTNTGVVHFTLPPFVGGMLFQLAPGTAAIIVAAVVGGGAGARALLARMFIWRVGLTWYAVAIGLPFLIQILAILALVPFGGSGLHFGPNALSLLLLLPIGFLTCMGEEIGWRGFALPRVQARLSALTSAIVVGLLWGVWHLPPTVLGMIRGTDTLLSFLVALVLVAALSVLMTWVFNNSQGSLLLAALFHAFYNAKGHLLVVTEKVGGIGPKNLAFLLFFVGCAASGHDGGAGQPLPAKRADQGLGLAGERAGLINIPGIFCSRNRDVGIRQRKIPGTSGSGNLAFRPFAVPGTKVPGIFGSGNLAFRE
jgi:uncharacterized protein